MGGKALKGILTAQCASIQRAIELCMPTTIHRWCIWHIMKKIPRKINGYKGHIDIEQEMSHVVWNSYTKDAFDRNWNDFLTKYGLGGNKWLSELYEDWHIWIPQHNNCLTSREQADREFNAADFHTVIPFTTKSAIEAQFQHVYTHEKFREVQAQFKGKVNCITRSMHSTLGFITYEVIEQVSNSTFNKFVITYDAVSRDVKCHCLLFESRGILCRHSLSVLSFERVHNVAPKYILERWSKNIKRRHTHIKSNQDEPLLEPRSKRFDELVFRSHNICEFDSECEELTGILYRAFDKVMAEMEEYQERSKRKSLLTHEEVTLSNVNDLQSPPRVKTRGQPKNKLGSNLEKKISNSMKKKKKTTPSEIIDSVKLHSLQCTRYELSKRGLYKF
ncbi:protein FAR-RED IMPAIRED RESPONSE 1-like [Arachis stenosperma]|uniref:protein FAR-RED IMPAIRED RESPONSE 1-like n=1 Tax=Arachis stenosperma TaxID=217475 RepID=UPI0025ACDF89|nr:protein FAR-RED IMPAIRED RESPONSE 1-like [Arachis stenosperma]